jgi:hypothetical protein
MVRTGCQELLGLEPLRCRKAYQQRNYRQDISMTRLHCTN